MKDRFKYIGAVYLFLIKDNQILLQRRFQTGYEDGNYGIPSGHLDGNETVREGCAREMKEEINIDINPEDIEVVHTMHRIGTESERFDFFMVTSKYNGEIKNNEPNKCDDLSWFDLDNLPENIIGYVNSALQDYKNGVTFSELRMSAK